MVALLFVQPVTTLEQLLEERILILDGAMGTMIQRYKLDEAGYRGERHFEGSCEHGIYMDATRLPRTMSVCWNR